MGVLSRGYDEEETRPMKILVDRIKSDDDSTLSTIYIDGKFECFGLEDEYRESKIANETRIPAGIYNVGVRNVGGFNGRYGRKYPLFHQGMLQVLNVPGFEYILIHVGNTDEDTAGCLLVGAGAMVSNEITIQSSTQAYTALYKKCISAALANQLTIEYRDGDR